MGKQSTTSPSDPIRNTKARQYPIGQANQQQYERLRHARQQRKDERTLWRYEAADDLDALSARDVALLARHSVRQSI